MRALRANLMSAALQCRLNLAAAVTGNAANIANAAATGGHLPNQPVCIGTATPIVNVVANKLPAAGFAEVFLLGYCRICRFALYSVHGNEDSKR